MKLAKVIIVILVCGVIGALFFGLGPSQHGLNPQSSQGATVRRSADRGDDPTYAEEVRQLTAMQRQAEQAAKQRAQELENELSRLNNEIEDTRRADQLSESDNQRIKELEAQVETLSGALSESLAPLKDTIAKLSSQQTNARTTQSSGPRSELVGYSRIRPFGGLAAPYSQSLRTSGGRTNPINVPLALAGSNAGGDTNGFNRLGGSDSIVRSGQTLDTTPIPVFTLHDGSILADSRSATPLIGRVPNGGNTNDPFRFRIVTGAENIMANGHRVPGMKDAIWSGYAIGVREESCVRGYLDSVTFVFEDGTIATHPKSKSNSRPTAGTLVTQSLGYLADPAGTQCLPGLLISNASSYLRGRSIAAFAEGLAAAYASAQTTVDHSGNGNISAFVDGDTFQFGVGRGLSRSASEVATYLRQRQENAFDVVYFPTNQPVQIFLEQQIDIDYDPQGRKTRYDLVLNKETSRATPLD